MKKIDPKYIKSTVTKESFTRLGVHAFLLFNKGAPLGLLAAILHMRSFTSVYKLIIAENKEAQRGNRRRPPYKEQECLVQWELKNPAIAAAMKERDISPRKWCCLHELVTLDNDADLFALIDPETYEYNTAIPVLSLLQRDFPEAFGLKATSYWPKDVNPDLYCHHRIEHPNNKNMHVFTLGSLGIKVMNKSYFTAFSTFTKRLRHEVTDHRLVLLLNGVLNKENINTALAWLPQDVSIENTPKAVLNPGIGHQVMRRMEEEARLRASISIVSGKTR